MSGDHQIFGRPVVPMSLNNFRDEVKLYCATLQYEEVALSNACNVFSREAEIWPDQCKRIIALLRRVDEPAYKFDRLLQNLAQLPPSVIPHSWPLLISLVHMRDQ